MSSPSTRLRGFSLIASFGRCKFRLNCCTVGLLLQAALGDIASSFNVEKIGDQFLPNKWVFTSID
jgi:hypothetical protein